jgi:hypothetical protein
MISRCILTRCGIRHCTRAIWVVRYQSSRTRYRIMTMEGMMRSTSERWRRLRGRILPQLRRVHGPDVG